MRRTGTGDNRERPFFGYLSSSVFFLARMLLFVRNLTGFLILVPFEAPLNVYRTLDMVSQLVYVDGRTVFRVVPHC